MTDCIRAPCCCYLALENSSASGLNHASRVSCSHEEGGTVLKTPPTALSVTVQSLKLTDRKIHLLMVNYLLALCFTEHTHTQHYWLPTLSRSPQRSGRNATSKDDTDGIESS